ncbi:hypothetical protein LTS08_000768 [Lithohypha guttulata]|nr:hypothetical protein LTS08_000768 [Lithohypha guttulata]
MGSLYPSPAGPRFLVIGAGSRGCAYARAVTVSTAGSIAAVAEPDAFKLKAFGQKYIWKDNKPQEGQAFTGWQEFVEWKTTRRVRAGSDNESPAAITGVFVCTLDETHATIIRALAPLNLHIMCEKPLALSMTDCISISGALAAYPPRVVSIGHVLRYSPHNILLRDLLANQQVIGEVVSIEHTEPVGWWHFAHSLTGDRPHFPSNITSSGSLTHFRPLRKPKKAGKATNCLSCAAEPDCKYSAKSVYHDKFLMGAKDTGWPVKIVVPEIEDIVNTQGWERAGERLLTKLTEDYTADTPDEDIASKSWYGRCVYESDNNVVDDQFVTMTWDEDALNDSTYGRGPKQALFHMTYPTQAQCDRRGRIYGSDGEITYDSHTITVYTFHDARKKLHSIPKQAPEVEASHGGGDWGLAGAFVRAVEAVDNGTATVAEAQTSFVGCDLDEIIRSHAVVFAAEHARTQRNVVSFPDWWSQAATTMKTE